MIIFLKTKFSMKIYSLENHFESLRSTKAKSNMLLHYILCYRRLTCQLVIHTYGLSNRSMTTRFPTLIDITMTRTKSHRCQ
ncbi:hypothetical protein QL285_091226 [Trifolium repens]|nr:hypothetical protein QL285_091226 [Trifolium repens]